MTLYLGPDITPDEIRKAAKAGIRGEPLLLYLRPPFPWRSTVLTRCPGVKSYPRGVTTNSSAGIEDYGVYYPVFKAMEQAGMVLNLHGEVPSDPALVSPDLPGSSGSVPEISTWTVENFRMRAADSLRIYPC